jgi:hypothetical protein
MCKRLMGALLSCILENSCEHKQVIRAVASMLKLVLQCSPLLPPPPPKKKLDSTAKCIQVLLDVCDSFVPRESLRG